MVWVFNSELPMGLDYAISPPLETGLFRVSHLITGRLQQTVDDFEVILRGVIAQAGLFDDDLSIFQPETIYSGKNFEIFRWDAFPEFDADRVAVKSLIRLSSGYWKVRIDDWI
ncbi:MAG: hypothetical protein HC924_15955 [Synechococcaceae cyanobacterium SM2_3_2]|nr:hypothetical protein [Synechococcaceae cyanobacterium SM2_3_2]